jgi:hypothetical protein
MLIPARRGAGPNLSPGAGPETPKEEFGPPPPPWMGGPDPHGLFTGTPDWTKLLMEEAQHDEDVAKMIEGCDGDPKKIYMQIKQRFDARSEEIMRESAGAPFAFLPPPQLVEQRHTH